MNQLLERRGTAEERLERLLELQSLMARVSREIGPALELRPVLSTVLVAMRSLIEFKGGTIQLVDERGVYVAAADPEVSAEVAAARVPVGKGLGGRVVTSGAAIYSPDIGDDPRVDPALRSLGSNATMRSYLAVPLICLGRVIGLMQIDSREVDAFDTDDLHVLQGLATQVAGAIESARHNEEIMELERLKGDFLARVSHELRTPLTIMTGFVSTLSEHDDRLTSDERKRMLGRVEAAANRLESLIDELLTVTQFEAGALHPRPQSVVLREVLDLVRDHSLNPEAVAVRCADDVKAYVDPNLLRHAVALLADNAIKYAGDVVLRGAIDDDGRTYVEVRDQGTGIPPELRDRIFDRFTRGAHSGAGMGLGLSLVRTLAAGLDARVTLEDVPVGACFRLTLGPSGASAVR